MTLGLLTVLLSLSAAETPSPQLPVEQRITIRADRLEPASFAGRRKQGTPITLDEAWQLDSSAADFGGLSAMILLPEGLRAVSDNGVMFDFAPTPMAAQWSARMHPLFKGCLISDRKADRDVESLVSEGQGRTQWFGIEFRNQLCRVAPDGTRTIAPPAMKDWLKTGGPEAMVRLRDGRFLVLAERSPTGTNHVPALLYARDPFSTVAVPKLMRYVPPPGYAPVDAVELPDGRLLVLHRDFKLLFRFSAILSIVTIENGQLKAEPVVWLDRENGAENWEALAIQDEGRGKATIWLASDDNFIAPQRTYLLKLSWTGPSRPQ